MEGEQIVQWTVMEQQRDSGGLAQKKENMLHLTVNRGRKDGVSSYKRKKIHSGGQYSKTSSYFDFHALFLPESITNT